MNITFMVVTVFLFFFGLIFLGKLIISGYVTYLLSVKFGDEYITSQMKRDIYIFGIVADLAAIGIVSLVLIILKYSLQGTTQSRYLTGGVPPVRFSM